MVRHFQAQTFSGSNIFRLKHFKLFHSQTSQSHFTVPVTVTVTFFTVTVTFFTVKNRGACVELTAGQRELDASETTLISGCDES